MKGRFDWVTAVQLASIPIGIAVFCLLLGEGRIALACTVAAISVTVFVAGSIARNTIRRRARARVQERLDDDVLGPLRYDGEESWDANVTADGKQLKLKIGGDTHPDPELVAQGRRLVRSLGELRGRVGALLADFSRREPSYADEISALEIDEVQLVDGGGMIYFSGGSPHRGWRCNLIDESPVGLGFDS